MLKYSAFYFEYILVVVTTAFKFMLGELTEAVVAQAVTSKIFIQVNKIVK